MSADEICVAIAYYLRNWKNIDIVAEEVTIQQTEKGIEAKFEKAIDFGGER